MFYRLRHLCVRYLFNGLAGNKYQVEPRFKGRQLKAKYFSHLALNPIPLNRAAYPFAHNKANPAMLQVIWEEGQYRYGIGP
jgi:hypothetical protein